MFKHRAVGIPGVAAGDSLGNRVAEYVLDITGVGEWDIWIAG